MSGMSRDEMLELRQFTLTRLEEMRRVGDYGAGAMHILENAEGLLQLIDHELGKMQRTRNVI